jgi:hypothetical protein
MYSKFKVNGNPFRVAMATKALSKLYRLSLSDARSLVEMIQLSQMDVIDLFTRKKQNLTPIIENEVLSENAEQDIFALKLAGVDVIFDKEL